MSSHRPGIKGMSGKHGSLWISTSPETDFAPLQGDMACDVAIIGGGLTGLTCAWLLTQAGYRTAVLEKNRLLCGTTGHTTAKITSAHGVIYGYLVSRFGRDLARLYAEANESAIRWIRNIVDMKKIDCDFRRINAYTYAETDAGRREIEAEVNTAQELGLPAFFADASSLPIPSTGAIGFREQALFHPRKYLLGLLESIRAGGGAIFENTAALDVKEGNPCQVTTDKGKVSATHVIVATLYPFLMAGEFFAKLYPRQSYVMAATVNGGIPEGMYYSAGDYGTTIRPHPYDGGEIAIFGGDAHKVGQGGDIIERYRTLERKLRETLNVRSLDYYWTTHDAVSVDRVPYIGKVRPRARNVYVATGFKQWGITHGTVAAMILTDMIQGKENPWLKLYDATRLKPKAGAREFLLQNLNVGKELIKGLLSKPPRGPGRLAKDAAAIVEQDSEKTGVYKDGEGALSAVSLRCTHMGCQANWDNAERTWDCPCHGSRFAPGGDVLYGPATRPLAKKEIKEAIARV